MKLSGSKCRLIGLAGRHDLEIISRFKMGAADNRSFTVAMSTVVSGHNLATDEHTDAKLSVAEDKAARQLIELTMAILPSPKAKQPKKTHADFAREGVWDQAVRSLCTERGWIQPTIRVTSRGARHIRATGKRTYNAATVADVEVTVRIGSSSAVGHGLSRQEATADGFRRLYHDLTSTA